MSYAAQTGRVDDAGPDVILFDLGGVLMNFGGLARLSDLAGKKQDAALRTRWISSEWVQAFERGACTAGEFAQSVVNELELDLTPAAFLDDYRRLTRHARTVVDQVFYGQSAAGSSSID